ncbi:hypothetical protein JCGZ_23415 [Jatropha curcas]|uniref:J domain-containing protein n=1 Tax=Jatropha curcas TaxID=180498 RepID=A0A067JI70_JATCU|nr:uncharacterized protein LOC105647608 [Jatropha curcas]KDP23582.1 hypothetical protein JCGZ_23415 [Jatropha curcas]
MECNKEEAIRAKEIAEKKMQAGDFIGARRIALKAQQLNPDLDNISQLLMVCEVHCSAQNKLNGSEMDWYGILQIEQFADESVVKKHYRKLALSLHPDKNKLAGAEAAFKLIGEANRVLMDPTKRTLYDMKCRGLLRSVGPKPTSDKSNRSSLAKKQRAAANKFSSGPHSQSKSSHASQQPQQPTFWTYCPSCSMRYQYYREYRKKMLRCQSCHQPFIAHDVGISPGSTRSMFFNEKRVPEQVPCNVVPQNNAGKPSGDSFPHRVLGSESVPEAGKAVDVGGCSKPKEVNITNAAGTSGGSKPREKMIGHVDLGAERVGPVPVSGAAKPKESETLESAIGKRQRKSVEELSACFDKGTNVGNKANVVIKGHGGDLPAQNSRPCSRRSSRLKQDVAYEENVYNGDFVVLPTKRSRKSCSSSVIDESMEEARIDGRVPKEGFSSGCATVVLNKKDKVVKQNPSFSIEERSSNKKNKTGDYKVEVEAASSSENAGKNLENNDEKSRTDMSRLNSNEALKSEILCPDADFNDFMNDKAENSFAVNQVWAIYDSVDGMPRFYARVRKVHAPGFKLHITWLEAISHDEAELQGCDANFPVACGMYENGGTEETVDRLMFSHQMYCTKGGRRGTYMIYPKKGETWALFKDSDMARSSDLEKCKLPNRFEIVEVLTDFIEDVGIGVAYLGKVKGFVSVFQRADCDDVLKFCIRPNELYRFSHRIPSFRMTGHEGKGVPAGSFELDTAALPDNFGNLVDLGDVKVGKEKLVADAISSYSKSSEYQVEPVKVSEKRCMPKHLSSCPEKRTSALRRSPRELTGTCKDDNEVDAGQQATGDGSKVSSHDELTQPEEICTSFQAKEKITIHKKHEKSKYVTNVLTPRRSPRGSSKRNSQVNASKLRQKTLTGYWSECR